MSFLNTVAREMKPKRHNEVLRRFLIMMRKRDFIQADTGDFLNLKEADFLIKFSWKDYTA